MRMLRTRRARAGLASFAALGLLATSLLTPPAVAAGPTPADAGDGAATAADPFPAYTRFNVPAEDGTRDRTIEDELVRLADGVPAGSYIRGIMYSWSSPVVAEALKRAAARGVIVRIVLDETGGGVNTRADNTAVPLLKSANLDDLVICGKTSSTVAGSTACIGNKSNSINHNKVFTFSTSGTMKRVVFVSSQNLTFSQNNLFNSALIVHEDYDLYDHFTAYFNDMRAQRKNNDYFNAANGYYKSPNTAVTVYHSPRADSDTLANRLAEVNAYASGCAVDVAHAQFTDARPQVATQLRRIGRMGCRVRVVYGSMGSTAYATLNGQPNVSLKKYHDAEASNYDGRVVTVHSKNIIIKGTFAGLAGRSVVFTGSHNVTDPALTDHDETLVKIEHPTVWNDFHNNFETLWSRAKCVNPENGSCTT
ncbi:phospholipase D-like domain-containing protein [Plantactinospora sp. KLBMP9567]|uniref:phospholipase D-like domain-containing protein n=1 Tax=Plantactinospora sp. KLBMP9567 TaxID=3085900 RepID=UPI002980C3E5|nr:phospholipase D-like domain-containing protein [Plantactinospora sp. KLBMP9567]MDW5329136.1 phospholipase D-like domain-containing protein [Plantactinospora sp. KLBMP9567]MDW5329960.1 phospholipase D-like domain-containing protein [Plantactinospora sp. KLBMP9567]